MYEGKPTLKRGGETWIIGMDETKIAEDTVFPPPAVSSEEKEGGGK